ncbi:MAG: zinc carboxypeptidase, partial [Mucilaginibacter polytrichastri]|nr:zinc carboxypeptidase [Mucilaginibacter polytrichastri]
TNAEQVSRLATMLTRNGIGFGYGASAANGFGFNYINGKTERFKIEKNDLVISSYQPKSVLLNVLFEPKTLVTDSNTYDITAWALPYAFGLKTYALKQDLKPASGKNPAVFTQENLPDKPYAYAAEWNSVASVQFLTGLFKAGIKVRYIELPISANGKQIAAGSLLITRTVNRNVAKFDQHIRQLADSLHIGLHALTTGFAEKGNDLGSDKVHVLNKPRVMVVSGEDVSPNALGEVWQFFEQQIGYPLSLVRAPDLGRINWGSYDVAIFPDGQYDYLNDERLQTWVKQGGKLIVMENAAAQLAGKKGFALEKKDDGAKSKDDGPKKDAQKEQYAAIKSYENRDREFLKFTIPGAIYRVDLDNTHPLGFGFPGYYFTLKLNDNIYPYFKDEGNWNVGTFKKDNLISGFVGQNAKARLKDGLVLGVQEMGRGTVVYLADDPLFRSFWESGKLLFSNAVFMVGN